MLVRQRAWTVRHKEEGQCQGCRQGLASEKWKDKWNCTSRASQLAGAPPVLTFSSFEEGIGRGERNLKVLNLLCVL